MIPIFTIIIAFGLPVLAMFRKSLKRPYLYAVGSYAACCFGMWQELYTVKQRLYAGDIAGLEDAIVAVLIICAGLAIVTTALNLIMLGINYEK